MGIMSAIMPKAMNPAVMAAENRTLGLQQSGVPAAVMPSAGDPVAAAAAAPTAGAAQASLGADAVQAAPPQPLKIIASSVVRGAVSGAAMMFGINSFGPKIPFIAKAMTKALSFVPFVKLAFPFQSTLIALAAGAVVGGVFGLVTGIIKSRKAAAQFAQQQAQAPQAATDPAAAGADAAAPAAPGPAAPAPVTGAPPTTGADKAKKNPVMGPDYKGRPDKNKTSSKTKKGKRVAGSADGPGRKYHIKRGDTLWALSRRYGVSIDAIVKANPEKIKDPDLIYAGDTIIIPAKGD